MADYNHLKVATSEGVAEITLARPKHNVLNIEMMNELNSALEGIVADNELKCLVFRGEGRSFCAGVDVGEHDKDHVQEMTDSFSRIFELLDKLEIPVVAAVHGAALGGGMELAIAADVIVASKSAKFGQPEVKLGFIPPYAAIRLPELVGLAKAIEICTTGATYTAKQARKLGLVSRVIDDDEFEEHVQSVVKELKDASPYILRLNKRAVKEYAGDEFTAALEDVAKDFVDMVLNTEDTQEGIQSFYEKRKPEWKNK